MALTPASTDAEVLHVEADRVVVGQWSGKIADLAGTSGTLRGLLRQGEHQHARALLCSRSTAEQAALVAMDENPEELLALTGMDERGRPAYRTEVVAVLPEEVLTELVAPRNARLARFNVELIKTMPPETFARSVAHTIAPILHHDLRSRVSWEWLEAVAAIQDHDKAAELLRGVDEELLVEAIMDRLDAMDLGAVGGASPAKMVFVSRAQVFLSGFTGVRPGDYIDDTDTSDVLDALYEAAPDLLSDLVQRAVKRSGGY